MRKTKSKLLLSFIFLVAAGGLIFARQSLSYSTNNTHPFLTEKIAEFHNLKNKKNTISKKEIGWMMKGAVQEDDPPRWINHFYDPVHKEGWTGEHFGDLSEKEGYETGADMAPKPAIASVDWAENQEYQAAYGRQYGNRTWQKAVKSYIDGDKETAFLALGDILHLIEDLSVPAHTRNDSHPGIDGDPGSPYEDYAKKMTNFYEKEVTVVGGLIKENKAIPNFQKLSDAFNSLADYSNKNFFSEDTIDNEDFMEPNLGKLDTEIKYVNGDKTLFLKRGNDYLAYLYSKDKYSINDEKFILPSYLSHLVPKMVLTGAGVVDLFFRDVEKYRKSPKTLEPIVSNSDEPFFDAIKSAPKIIAIKTADYFDERWISTRKKAISAQSAIVAAAERARKGFGGFAESIKYFLTKREPVKIVPARNLATAVDIGSTPSLNDSDISDPHSGERASDKNKGRELGERAKQTTPVTQKPVRAKAPAPFLARAVPAPLVPSARLAVAINPKISPTRVSATPSSFFAGGVIGSHKKIKPSEEKKPKEEKPQEKKGEIAPEAPIIVSPPDFSQTFTSPDIVFSGTAEASSTVSANFDGATFATTTADSNGAWTFPLSFGEGTTTISFFVSDFAGNVSSSTEISFFVDSIPPDVSLSATECPDSVSGEICLSATTTLNISWSSNAPDLSFFTINANGVISTTTATSTIIENIKDNSNYSFSVSAVDAAGNRSATSTRTAEISTKPVIINEIAWMGTGKKTASDEWIELYNRTDYDINLAGWTLYSETDMKPYIVFGQDSKNRTTENSVIPAKGYYLIERTNDDTTSEIADWYGSFGNGLNNSGEVLILSHASTTVERIPRRAGSYGGWIGGLPINGVYRTMERRDPNRPGSERSNWGYNSASIRNGLSADGKKINGTPGRRNSLNYLFPIGSENVHLTRKNSPYFVDSSPDIFKGGAVLSIDPGTVIKFGENTELSFEGGASLMAEGTAELPIVFTSLYDNTVGGIMNEERLPEPGDWLGVNIEGGNSVIDYTSFRYALRNGLEVKNFTSTSSNPSSINNWNDEMGGFDSDGKFILQLIVRMFFRKIS